MPFPDPLRRLGDSLTEGLEDARPDGMHAAGPTASQHPRTPQRNCRYAILIRPLLAHSQRRRPALLQPTLVSLWGGGNDMLRPKAYPTAMAVS